MIKLIVGLVVVMLGMLLFKASYIKAPPNKAIIISGLRKKPKTLVGRAGFKVPFFERKDELPLELMAVDVKTNSAVPTQDFINIVVDANVTIKISDGEGLEIAAQNFLNKSLDHIKITARQVLEGNIREIIGQMNLKDMVNNRKGFTEKVSENAIPDLKKMGLDIISFNVQNFTDGDDVITNLGIDNIAKIKKDAAIARAISEKEVEIARAQAQDEANAANVAAAKTIANRENELEIRKAELKKESDLKRAEADAAYQIQQEEQRKTIEMRTAEADIVKNEQAVIIKTKEAEIEAQRLDAEIKKKAEAEKFAILQKSDAELYTRQKKAEAELFERQKDAEAAKAVAEAEKFRKLQEAEGIKAIGLAEAEATEKKGLAEANALEKKAEAMKKYGNAAMLEMVVKTLPQMAEAVAKPISQIKDISIIDSGNGDSGVGSVGGYVPSVLAKTIESVKNTTGIDLKEIIKADTYDAKVNRNININGLDNVVADTDKIVSEVSKGVKKAVDDVVDAEL